MKLHVGCGGKRLEGYVNIDHRETPATDVIRDACDLKYSEVDEIYSSHVFEHLDRKKAIKEWHSVLRKGGKLIIEVPDVERAIKEKFNGNLESILIFLYGGNGNYEGTEHKYGWSKKLLKRFVERHGFKVTNVGNQQAEGRNPEAGIRIEAYKL